MKKIVICIIAIVTLALVVICSFGGSIGNRQIGIDTTQTFAWGIIQLGNGELIEGTVTSWRDFDDGDEVQLTINEITYLTHYSNVILTTKKP